MAHHLGIGSLPGPMLFTVPATPGLGLVTPVPPGFEDANHINGISLEPAATIAGRSRRAKVTPATGDLARLLARQR